MQNIKKNKQDQPTLVGLANLENTCFSNSCLQVLNNTHELNNFLVSKNNEKYKKNR